MSQLRIKPHGLTSSVYAKQKYFTRKITKVWFVENVHRNLITLGTEYRPEVVNEVTSERKIMRPEKKTSRDNILRHTEYNIYQNFFFW